MPELLRIDDALWVWSKAIGLGIYDFDFRSSFPCRSPRERPTEVVAVGRCGSIGNYREYYQQLLSDGIRLANSPDEQHRVSELAAWYPLLADLTPRSVVYEQRPSGEQVANDFCFPVFVKGSRQTSRHRRSLSIVESASAFDAAMTHYAVDPILQWQAVVVRELVKLRCVEDTDADRLPTAFEFRTFWWHGRCVGSGRYWWEGRRYDWTAQERAAGLALATEAAQRLSAPFLVLDIAMTNHGKWIVIECNDAQESGYAGVSPIGLWQAMIDIEKAKC